MAWMNFIQAQDGDEVFVTGSTLYAGDGVQPPPPEGPDTSLMVITPSVSAAVDRRTEHGWYFC